MPSLVQSFAAARLGVGALSLLAPSLSARVFGFDPGRTEPALTQLFASRECALALATATSSGEARRKVLALGVAIDAADSVACLIQIRRGNFSNQAKLLTAAGAVSFALIGAAALAQEDEAGNLVTDAPAR